MWNELVAKANSLLCRAVSAFVELFCTHAIAGSVMMLALLAISIVVLLEMRDAPQPMNTRGGLRPIGMRFKR